MKNKYLLTTLIAVAIIACTFLLRDGLTYLIISLMALTIMGLMWANRSGVIKVARWAKANPKKAQGLIVGLQLILMGLGIMTGKNLDELGYQFSNTTAYVFTAIMFLGFASVPFLPKRNTIAIPKVVNRQRLAYLGISLSTLVMMALLGNRIGEAYPNALLTRAIDTIDQSIFSDQNIEYIGHIESTIDQLYNTDERPALAVLTVEPIRDMETIDPSFFPELGSPQSSLNEAPASKKDIRQAKKDFRQTKKDIRKQYRMAASTGGCIAAFLIILLLIATSCAGICLIIGAFGTTGAGAAIAGIVVLAGSIWGFTQVGKLCK